MTSCYANIFLIKIIKIMSQNAGFFGKLAVLGGSAFAMISRCATAGDDIVRIGARGFDDVAMVSDDVIRYGDDVFQYKNGLLNNTNDALLSSGRIARTEMHFDDVFLNMATEGANWLLDKDQVEFEVPEENLLSDFPLDSVKSIRLTLREDKYIFNEETKANFLKILSYSTPIDDPEDPYGKLIFLRGGRTYLMLLGKDWVGIKTTSQKGYKYYSSKVDLTKGL